MLKIAEIHQALFSFLISQIFIVQTFHFILDHFIAIQITAHFLYPFTLLFPLFYYQEYANSLTNIIIQACSKDLNETIKKCTIHVLV